MPTYEYRCDACEGEFEVEKRMSDPVAAPCPACGSDHTHRLISHSSFVLKGSGWYVTDYARKNGGNGAGAGVGGKPNGNGKKDGSSESKEGAPAAPAATESKSPAPTPAPSSSSPSTTAAPSTPSS